MFSRLEQAHRMTLYCGIVKLHKADGMLVRQSLNDFDLTRKGFREMMPIVFGKKAPQCMERLKKAEEVRDKVLHGKEATEKELREAISNILGYAIEMNDWVYQAAGVRPFGDKRGFKGRAEALDKSTTRWILKGMGLPAS